MSLIHRSEQITADVVALECHNPECRRRFVPDDWEWSELLDTEGELTCWDCGTGGLIPHRQSKLAERFPAELIDYWMPLPRALMRVHKQLGLGAHELLVVIALEDHRRLMGDDVWPSVATLSELTSVSDASVRRALNTLVVGQLIKRWRPRLANGTLGTTRYNLDGLWRRVASAHCERWDDAGRVETTSPPLTVSGGPALKQRSGPALTVSAQEVEATGEREAIGETELAERESRAVTGAQRTTPRAISPDNLDDDIPF